MKIYARQVAPELQESPLFLCDFPDNIILTGNKDYHDHTTPEYDHIQRYFDDMASEWDARKYYIFYAGGTAYTKKERHPAPAVGDILAEYGFKRNDGKPWTTKQRHAWRELMEKTPGDDEKICAVLGLLTGKRWTSSDIRGCCQGDWQGIFYSMDDYSDDDIELFETEYFNTGTEWVVHDDATPPATPADISGYSVYCHAWNNDGIKKEIADAHGCDAADVVLYAFSHWTRTENYEEV